VVRRAGRNRAATGRCCGSWRSRRRLAARRPSPAPRRRGCSRWRRSTYFQGALRTRRAATFSSLRCSVRPCSSAPRRGPRPASPPRASRPPPARAAAASPDGRRRSDGLERILSRGRRAARPQPVRGTPVQHARVARAVDHQIGQRRPARAGAGDPQQAQHRPLDRHGGVAPDERLHAVGGAARQVARAGDLLGLDEELRHEEGCVYPNARAPARRGALSRGCSGCRWRE
jgi:hypothetical protein